MLIAFLVFLGALYFAFSASPLGAPERIHGDTAISLSIAIGEWAALTAVVGFASFHLDLAGIRAASPRQRARPWMPICSTVLFAAIVFFARFLGGVPIEIGALLAIPCVLLPPLTYRVTHFHSVPQSAPLFSMEETCLVLDSAKASVLIRQFLERYPNTRAFLYRNPKSHSAGGLFLHNRERLSVPLPTYLEVTLNCPFTMRWGVFAEGRETFRAYLNRSKPNGCVIQYLPAQTWDDWLSGLTQREWFERINDLEQAPATHAPTRDLPCQFLETDWSWEILSLT